MRQRKPSLPPSAVKPVPHSVMKPPPVRSFKVPPVGAPPNPKRPHHKREKNGGELNDLFALFPDLPRSPRPATRPRTRLLAARLAQGRVPVRKRRRSTKSPRRRS